MQLLGKNQKAWHKNENWIIPHEGNTFHARDIFAPFAAGYASGQLKLEEFESSLILKI